MTALGCSPGKASCSWVALTGSHAWFLALVTRLFLQSQVSDLHRRWSINSITDQFQTANPLILPKGLNRSQSLRTEIRSLQFSLWTFCSWWFLLCDDGMKPPGGTSLASAGSFHTALSRSGNTWKTFPTALSKSGNTLYNVILSWLTPKQLNTLCTQGLQIFRKTNKLFLI